MSEDAYDWEFSTDKFETHVLTAIYVCGATEEGHPEIKCAFLESEESELYLPHKQVDYSTHAATIAVRMFKEYVGLDHRAYDIVPYGFFDPILPQLDDDEMCNRIISLGYKTRVIPGTPLHPDLRLLSHDEIELARQRIKRGHYAAYRAGIS